MDQDLGDSGRSSADPAMALPTLEDEAIRKLDNLPDINSDGVREEPYTSDNMDQTQPPASKFQLGIDGICAKCRELFKSTPKALPKEDSKISYVISRHHYESAMAVQESSRNGCKICTLFIETCGFEPFEEDIESLRVLNAPRIRVETRYGSWGISFTLEYRENSSRLLVLSRLVDRDSAAPIHEIIRPSPHSYLPLAKDWLKECIEKHEHCVKSDRQVLPTRLLYLGEDMIRLIHTGKNPGMQVQYATLSHAWGSIEFFRLYKDNIKDLQESVPEKQLTKTFRDAVYITRSLGLEYLWIDSLCIIQDDEQDWLRESDLMSSVYGGSTINIAAADSLDGNGGCLYDDMATGTTRKAFRYRLRMANRQNVRLWELAPMDLYARCTTESYLASRAWALQERLLAPRTLHFSKTDMLWECHEKDACSLFPEGLPQGLCLHYLHRTKGSLTSIWHLIVKLYSAAKLTRPSDKLVALSGLASAVKIETGDEYVAGMWRKDLDAQLLWKVYREKENVPCRPRPYRTPTWSWAALDTTIDFPAANTSAEHSYAHIHSVYTQPTGSNSLGQISGGLLTISCSVLMRGTTASKDSLDAEDPEPLGRPSWAKLWRFGINTIFAEVCWDAEEDHSGLLYFLPILENPSFYGDPRECKTIGGLVLRKLPHTEDRVQYSRLGIFRFYSDERRVLQTFLAIMEKHKQTTPKSDFSRILDRNEKYPDECQLIEII